MESYNSLEKLFYNKKNIEEELKKRLDSPACLKSGLEIYPLRKGERILDEKYELFCFQAIEDLLLQQKIFENSIKISKLVSNLPEIGRDSCLREIMISEIKKSNDIEGVVSTKQELYDKIDSKKKDKFYGIVNKYLEILNKPYTTIESIMKIKELYNSLFVSEIKTDKEYKLDGEHFRKGSVFIYKNIIDEKIHSGNPSEKSIIEDLDKLIIFMNKKDIPFLLKGAITHYFFEYIHPFYDGNGRFGRYIFSAYLARKLDLFTGLSLSYAINLKKSDYLKSFIEVSKPKNFGEVTFFVKNILETILIGQNSILALLSEKTSKLNFASEILKDLNLNENEKNILFLLIQNHIFLKDFPLRDMQMQEYLKKSRGLINKNLKSLQDKGYITKIKQKPSCHTISEKVLIMID